MRKVKLGEVLDVKRGTSLSGEFYSETGEKIRLTLGNFNYPGGGFKKNTSKTDLFFTGPVKPEYILKKGDIITPLTEQVAGLLGETARIPEDNLYIQSGDIGLVLPDEIQLNKDFAYYLISSPIVKKQLGAAAQQTKIRHTSPDAIKACEVYLPNLEDQAKIAAILDALNAKIENNNAICAELEAMAKLLYDYWFVQFDFQDENGKPYKSSGGKMVWSEDLKREIPEGWEVKTIGDISRMVNDSITPNKSSMYHHFSIPAFDDTHMPVYEPGASIDSNKYCVNDDYILVSKLNPQFKRIWVISKAPENSICSTEYMPFVSTNDAKEFLYSTLNSDAFYTFMINSSSSSTGSRKRMPPEMCPRFKIPYPKNGSVVTQYCNAVKPMLDRANSMYSENQELASLRDFLLPLLMNGQVVINSDE